ncbi:MULTISPECIES: hypothetical protein, partial [unclassified Rhizobium]|uniref:hypothetical protein n=1 Tax=unclassified Rhizobium TaxID=2613769 RepID=UPI00193E5B05
FSADPPWRCLSIEFMASALGDERDIMKSALMTARRPKMPKPRRAQEGVLYVDLNATVREKAFNRLPTGYRRYRCPRSALA